MRFSNETLILVGVLLLTVLIIVGGAFWAGQKGDSGAGQPVAEAARLLRDGSPTKGPANAKVTVVEFGDFECLACGEMAPVVDQLMTDNADKSVRFVFRQYPLQQHTFAELAAEAAFAAQAQNKYFEYSDQLFANQTKLDKDSLIKYAEDLKLNMDQFRKDLDSHKYQVVVKQDTLDGAALQLAGTPTFFINGVEYKGDYTLPGLQEAINAALK